MTKYLAIYGKPRYLGIIESDREFAKGLTVVVDSHRGEEYAVVAGAINEEQETAYRKMRSATEHGEGGLKNGGEALVSDLKFLTVPPKDELDAAREEFPQDEYDILLDARDILAEHKLDMKLIDVEFIRKRRKLFFYFSAEQRVDFRAYVRDLAREFKTRIELRQIGVRDEAKIIRGVAPCGQPCCCSYWLNQFAPINIRMVKEQNLALNPSKISGICGRLMCCMHYEHNVYHEMWHGLPNPGSKMKTPNGNIIVAGIDLAAKSVRCFIPGRGEVKVPVADFAAFKETVMAGKDWIVEVQEPAKVAFEALSVKIELEQEAVSERKEDASALREGEGSGEKPARKRRKKRPRSKQPAQGEGQAAAPARDRQPAAPAAARTEAQDTSAGGEAKRKSRRGRHRRGGKNRNKSQQPAPENQ